MSVMISTPASETRTFGLHPSMVDAIIRKQSGSAHKALLELLMNSVDAGAKSINLTLTNEGFALVDDGSGMTSKDDIVKYWETFATPHNPDDAVFGTHRIGRGQIMALAKTSWLTDEFRMEVDHKNTPGAYLLFEGQPKIAGMQISGDWYKPIRLNNAVFELKKLCRFIDADIFLNGVGVTTRPSTRDWTHRTDEAWLDLDPSGDQPLVVYNLGAYVTDFPPSKYGLSGTLVSKRQLQLNFARNDILPECVTWTQIDSDLKALRNTLILNGPLTRVADRVVVLEMLARGEVSVADVRTLPLITTIEGRTISIQQLVDEPTFAIAASVNVRKAESLARNGDLMIRQAVATAVGASSPESLVEAIVAFGKRDDCPIVPARPVQAINIKESYEELVVHDKLDETAADLSKRELDAFEEMRNANQKLVDALKANGFAGITPHPLVIGRLAGALACTNGHRITFDSGYIKRCLKSEAGCFEMLLTLIHEYGHHARRQEDIHDLEFFKAHHDVLRANVLRVVLLAVDKMITAGAIVG
jgi:hypothetical protein